MIGVSLLGNVRNEYITVGATKPQPEPEPEPRVSARSSRSGTAYSHAMSKRLLNRPLRSGRLRRQPDVIITIRKKTDFFLRFGHTCNDS